MKRVITLLLTICLVLSTMTAFANPFSDIEGHWAKDDIIKAYENKAVNGDDSGTFRPDDNISRAEFLKMLTALLAEKFKTEIPEVENPTHWADKFYNFALTAYLPANAEISYDGISPAVMSKENFDTPIKRWEMAYILSNAFANIYMILGDGSEGIKDIEAINEKYDESVSAAIKNLVYLGISNGDENGNFNAENSGSRAEAAVMINRASDLISEIDAYYTAMQTQQEEAYKQMEAEIKENIITYTKIPTGHPVVEVTMSNGKKFQITLYPEYAPQTCANFLELVRKKFYNGLTFHRVVPGFVAQGGDPNGDGTGNSDGTIYGEFAANGFEQNTLNHTAGVVSMARSQFPDSASCQFFICYDDASFLDGQYAAFGKVTKGMDIVNSFAEAELQDNGQGEVSSPVKPITIGKIEIIKNK